MENSYKYGVDEQSEKYKKGMLEKPSYASCINFRANFWKACLGHAFHRNLFKENIEHPEVKSLIDSLHIVHGAEKRYDDLFAANIHGSTNFHQTSDPEYKKEYIFFRIEQVPTPQLDPISTRLFNDFVKFGTSDYYGSFVHTSPLVCIFNEEGKIAPIDNLPNFGYDGESGRNSSEDFIFPLWMIETINFLQKNPNFLEIFEKYYPQYYDMVKNEKIQNSMGKSIFMRRTGGGEYPVIAPIDLQDFCKFLRDYPILALLVCPPPFAEIMIKNRFRPQNIEYRPIDKARSIDDYPEEYKQNLLGVSIWNFDQKM